MCVRTRVRVGGRLGMYMAGQVSECVYDAQPLAQQECCGTLNVPVNLYRTYHRYQTILRSDLSSNLLPLQALLALRVVSEQLYLQQCSSENTT